MTFGPKTEAFLAAVRVIPSISRAAKAAKVERGAHYRRLKESPEYRAAFEEAWAEGVQSMEDEAVRRAVEGVNEPLVWQGEISRDDEGQAVTVKRYSDGLLQFLLKGARPEKYRERHQIDGELTVTMAALSERLAAGRKRIAKSDESAESRPGAGE